MTGPAPQPQPQPPVSHLMPPALAALVRRSEAAAGIAPTDPSQTTTTATAPTEENTDGR